MATVGIIVNPLAGKDVRRLVTAASHTSDATKIGIVRRVVLAAAESGAGRVLLAGDPHRLAERAVAGAGSGIGADVEVLDEPLTGSRLDTTRAAARMRDEGVGVVVVLGGDGTCRDVATGWPDAPLVAISTGTNNVYPASIDGTAAGCAAGLVAAGTVEACAVARRSKRLVVHGSAAGSAFTDLALVDVALVAADFIGARAVTDPASVRAVVACIASPAATGLSAIAGRAHPVDRWEGGAVAVWLGAARRVVRVPIGPGAFADVAVAAVEPLADGAGVELAGPGVLAYDGERDRRLAPGESVTVTVDDAGPWLIDVDRTLRLAAQRHAFDAAPPQCNPTEELDDGD